MNQRELQPGRASDRPEELAPVADGELWRLLVGYEGHTRTTDAWDLAHLISSWRSPRGELLAVHPAQADAYARELAESQGRPRTTSAGQRRVCGRLSSQDIEGTRAPERVRPLVES